MKKLPKKKKKPEGKDHQASKTEDSQKEEEKAHDFGGLPPRDLKKNLGCG